MDLFHYIFKRVLISVITLFVVISATFFLMHSMPGDPFTREKAVPQKVKENLFRKYGLDKPLMTQYGIFLGNLARGDLGISMKYPGRSVARIIQQKFPVSAELGIRSLIFGILFGLLFGVIASLNHNKALDGITMVLAIIGVSIPGFILATIFQHVLGYQFSSLVKEVFDTRYQVLPITQWHSGLKTIPIEIFGWKLPLLRLLSWESFAYLFSWECTKYTVLPSAALGFSSMASVARLMRTSMLDVLHQDYIKTAKAKGISEVMVTLRHAIRNAILPIVTILGPMIAITLTGTFIVEYIFSIPGLGRDFVIMVQEYDYTMIMGLTVFYAAFIILMVMLVDIAYGFIDPRIRIAKGRA